MAAATVCVYVCVCVCVCDVGGIELIFGVRIITQVSYFVLDGSPDLFTERETSPEVVMGLRNLSPGCYFFLQF